MLDRRLHDILAGAAEILRPPRRMRVSEAAARYLVLERPGAESGPWNPDRTPYMVEPMDQWANREKEAIAFVGPARAGKTFALLIGGLAYFVTCDPGDYLIVHMAENTARKFSKDELARSHRHSPELAARLSPYASDDNVFDKRYKNGMLLKLAWPSINQLSGDTLRYVALTDYDRYLESIDGAGDAFSLGRKRIETLMSSGRVLVESSPGWPVTDPQWQPHNGHDAPPCKGIFAIYAQGTRKRWYWPCPECGEYFTSPPSTDAFALVKDEVFLACVANGCAIPTTEKAAMNRAGRWVAAGQTIDRNGGIHGEEPKTKIASYWLTGPAAAYQSWASLWRKHRAAETIYQKTASEEALKSVMTGDFGTAYKPRQIGDARDAKALATRAEPLAKRVVPVGVFFLTAAVDIQKNRFVVQVIGWGVGGERWMVDRYNIKWASRDGEVAAVTVAPASRLEDWNLITTDVIGKPYPLAWDGSRGLLPALTAYDTAGEAGATEQAYRYYRQLRKDGLAGKVMPIKGGSGLSGPRLQLTYPDSTTRNDRKANARGEVPVYILNTTALKDAIAGGLGRQEAGPGYTHFPDWLGDWFFDEMAAEVRTAKGWENPAKRRNEALDLMAYNLAAFLKLNGETLNWERPPAWADPDRAAIPLATDAIPPPPKPAAKRWNALLDLKSTRAEDLL